MPLPHDPQTATQRIDPDRIIRALLPPNVGDLLAFAVLVALIATLLFLPFAVLVALIATLLFLPTFL